MTNESRPLNVLFVCTHNSARSILAEALLNHIGGGRFRGWSAGSHPRGEPHPLALRVLREAGVAVDGLASKGWDAFAAAESPRMDLVITVCDSAAGEACPHWPGGPATAHWSFADPSALEGDDEARTAAFRRTMLAIRSRLELLVDLPASSLDRLSLQTGARMLASR